MQCMKKCLTALVLALVMAVSAIGFMPAAVSASEGNSKPHTEAAVLRMSGFLSGLPIAGSISPAALNAVSPTSHTLNVGDEATLVVETIPLFAYVAFPTGSALIWGVDNPAVATISGSGLTVTVTAIGSGIATVTAELFYFGTLIDDVEFTITVSAPATPTGIERDGDEEQEVPLGGNLQLSVTYQPDTVIALPGGWDVYWSTSDTAIATVNSATGEVTGVALGTATITAQLRNAGTAEGTAVTFEVEVIFGIRFGELTGTGASQQVAVYVFGPIPIGAELFVIRTLGGSHGMLYDFIAAPSGFIDICDAVVRLDVFLVDSVMGFFMGTPPIEDAYWIRTS